MADSGQITVATAGTAVQGPATGGLFVAVKALVGNAGNVYVGNDAAGDVTSANGFELAPGEGIVAHKSLEAFWFDSAVDGDKLSWLKLD
jgi:hypothetical protein